MQENLKRKIRSEDIILNQKLPINIYLPRIENSYQIELRSEVEILERALALLSVGLHLKNQQKLSKEIIAKFNISLTLKEHNIIMKDTHTIHFNEYFESMFILLWSLNLIEDINDNYQEFDFQNFLTFIQNKTFQELLEISNIKTKEDILNEADLIYRYNWICREYKDEFNDLLNPIIVQARHKSLNWLISYNFSEWDFVETDT